MKRLSTVFLTVGLLGMPLVLSADQVMDLGTRLEEVTVGEDFFVRWQADVTSQQKQDAYALAGVQVIWQSALVVGLERVTPIEREDNPARAMGLLSEQDGVLYAEPNYRVRRQMRTVDVSEEMSQEDSVWGAFAPNDPHYSKQWALNGQYGINVEKAWAITKGSKEIKVAVIDSGCDTKHEDFKGKITAGYDFVKKTANVTDPGSHGTHCTGCIGANANNGVGIAGINHELTIVPIRAVPGGSADETDADVISAFEFAVKQGVRVANCSFGKAQSGKAVADTITAAGEKGLLAVVAAGNDSKDINKTPTYPAAFNTPNMVVVAAIDQQGKMASFSNYGMNKVHLAAPGDKILSSVPKGKYANKSGTSMAAPQVTGVAALVLAANPSLTPAQVKDILIKTVKPLSSLKGKVTTGGTLDAAAAVKRAKK